MMYWAVFENGKLVELTQNTDAVIAAATKVQGLAGSRVQKVKDLDELASVFVEEKNLRQVKTRIDDLLEKKGKKPEGCTFRPKETDREVDDDFASALKAQSVDGAKPEAVQPAQGDGWAKLERQTTPAKDPLEESIDEIFQELAKVGLTKEKVQQTVRQVQETADKAINTIGESIFKFVEFLNKQNQKK